MPSPGAPIRRMDFLEWLVLTAFFPPRRPGHRRDVGESRSAVSGQSIASLHLRLSMASLLAPMNSVCPLDVALLRGMDHGQCVETPSRSAIFGAVLRLDVIPNPPAVRPATGPEFHLPRLNQPSGGGLSRSSPMACSCPGARRHGLPGPLRSCLLSGHRAPVCATTYDRYWNGVPP